MATAKTDKYVELTVHPQYKDNIERYMQVVRAVALQERRRSRGSGSPSLEKQLLRADDGGPGRRGVGGHWRQAGRRRAC